MGLLYKGLSVWVQSRLDPCPKEQQQVYYAVVAYRH